MQTILITGAASGIGFDTATALAKRGYHLIATARTSEGVTKLRKHAETEGLKNFEARLLDITQQDQVDEYLFQEIDILINNAGVGESGPIAEIPLERIRKNYEVNVFGTIAMTQVVVAGMMKRKRGKIITISSIAGRVTMPYLGVYCSTKHALESLFDGLRCELKPFSIPVVLIEPGLIYTGFNERMAATKYEWLDKKSAYKSRMDSMKKHDAELPSNSYKTDSVVRAICEAVESKNPKARYMRPSIYRPMIALLRALPTVLQDAILKRYV